MPLQATSTSSLPPFTFSLSPSPPPSPHPSSTTRPPAPRPPADFLPEKDMVMFGTNPLLADGELGRGLVKCGRCGKVGMEWAAGDHRRVCKHVLDGTPLVAKKASKASKTDLKKRRLSEDTSASPQKRARFLPSDGPLDNLDEEPIDLKGLKKSEIKKIMKDRARAEKKVAKEKEKEEIAERKRARANCPINLDRQCGVINDKLTPCARSLTCKTHTVGAKRAVEGRSRPYDELYLEWQREHNPNFKEPVGKKTGDVKDKKKDGAGGGAGGAGGGGPGKKKVKHGEEGDGVVGEGEEGLRELEQLVALTRLAGERCRRGISSLGSAPPPVPPPTSLTLAPPNSAGPGPATSPVQPTSRLGTAPAHRKPAFQPVWRTANTDFNDVGRMLVQALAARSSRPVTITVPAPSAVAGGAGGQGAGGEGGMGMQMGLGISMQGGGQGGVQIPAV
ncbi:hypothetical protein IAT38_005774 [Cryptococcus sp. DSM 104549]